LIATTINTEFNLGADIGSSKETIVNQKYDLSLTDGTGSGKAQVVWQDKRSILTGASETLDLKSLPRASGRAALTKMKALIIKVTTATTGYTLKLKAGASNGFSAIFSDATDELVVGAGGVLVLTSGVDGYTVGATTKTITITNPAGGTLDYDIIIIGEGAIS
jgi:hypothetical protein